MTPRSSFTALVLDEKDGATTSTIGELPLDALPEGEVLVGVEYSSLNYKDGLAVQGRARVVRRYPMVPGVDLAGTVVESSSPSWKPGDRILVNGWGMGENHWGGYSRLARIPADWPVAVPDGLTTEQAMQLGTAGYTAMLALMALEEHGLKPDGKEFAITGAGGGVGSLAVALLARRGYRVVAATGRSETHDYLRRLGAADIVERDELAAPSTRPLESARWGGAIDSVGGDTLAGLLRAMAPGSSIAVCGNAGGVALSTTVLPFILRGVSCLGIDSNYCPLPRRVIAWNRLAAEFPLELLPEIARTAPLADVPSLAGAILAGQIQGRVAIEIP